MYRESTDFTIIGAGISGLLTARELAQAGASVRVVERGRVGQESSWAGGGILSPLYPWRYPDPVSLLSQWSQRAYPELCRQLAEQSGIEPEWTNNGLLMLDCSDREAAGSWAQRFKEELLQLSGPQLRECEPALSADYAEALWLPAVAQVRNPRLLKALRASLESAAVEIVENCEVLGLLRDGSRVTGIETASGRMMSGRVVVAAGAWSGILNAGGVSMPPVHPVKGQMLLLRGEPGAVQRIVLGETRYVIPRRDGRVLVGSTMENADFDKTTTEVAKQSLLASARELIPLLGDYRLERHWAGLRPGSPAGVPFIGPHPELEGLYFNAGHYRNGVVMGPASARLAADLLLGREPILNPALFSLNRIELGKQNPQ